MKKLLILTVLGAFLLGGMAYATQVRVLTMGDVNKVVKDEANILIYPQTIIYYPNLVGGEIRYDGDGHFTDIYAHLENKRETNPWIFGAYFYSNENDRYWPEILQLIDELFDLPIPYDPPSYIDGTSLPSHRWTMLVGRTFGSTPVGFAWDWTASYQDDDAFKRSLDRHKFTLGVSPMAGKLELGMSFLVLDWEDIIKSTPPTHVTKPDGANMEISLNGRYFTDPGGRGGKWTDVIHGGFSYFKQGVKPSAPDKFELTMYMFEGGWAQNFQATDDILVVMDGALFYESVKLEQTGPTPGEISDGIFGTYMKLGLDAEVFRWMDLRCGVASYHKFEKFSNGSDLKYGYADTHTYLGGGFHWGNFNIDARIDPDFLSRGPYFISGEDGDLAWDVSLQYWLD
jgi:hypothetical protein